MGRSYKVSFFVRTQVMSELAVIILGAAIVNNFVLTQLVGVSPVLNASRNLDHVIALATATTLVLTVGSGLSYVVQHYLLERFDLPYLRTLSLILVMVVLAQAVRMLIRQYAPALDQVQGLPTSLATANGAALGVVLLNAHQQHDLLQSLLFGFGASLGFGLALILFATLRDRIDAADVPAAFRGVPIGLITAGIVALAFMGFASTGPQ